MNGELDFSIIVPTYNRPAQLAGCLDALERLAYPRDRFEVIVVDDGSVPAIDPAVTRRNRNLDLHILRCVNGGPAWARNRGAEIARGRVLAFTDDDCAPAPQWLNALAQHDRGDEVMYGGRTVNALPGNLCSVLSQIVVDVAYAHYNTDPNDARFFASNNLAVATRPFREIGGFDRSFTCAEDRDLCDRWLHRGRRLVYIPEATVYHAHALTLAGLWRQHVGYGRGAYRYHQMRRTRGASGLRIESAFYSALLLHPYAHAPVGRAMGLTLLLAFQQVANAAGFAHEMLRSERRP